MISLMRNLENNVVQKGSKLLKCSTRYKSYMRNSDEEFRVLQIFPKDPKDMKLTEREPLKARTRPKEEVMPVDQNWQVVWPTARSFNPTTVPLPVRQGYRHKKKPQPDKYGNAELMKIPNFLHLTPPAVKAHCEKLKQFCTKWPEGLETEEKCKKHFPVKLIYSDYCYSSPTIREPLARIVSLRINLSSLKLNYRAKDKMLRLVGARYNPKNDKLTIIADRCPTRKQNLDYVDYLLTAVYHVSNRIEPWESEKSLADMEYYDWETSKSKSNLITIHCWPEPPTDIDYKKIPRAEKYKIAVEDLWNKSESKDTLNNYKNAVKDLFNFK